jgi:selenocysteine lyase/cysteine desulfurase
MDKRQFLRAVTGLTMSGLLGERAWQRFAALSPATLAQDETFWAQIRAKYRLKPDYVNLENGYYSMMAQDVLEAFVGHVREVNLQAAYYMRTKQVDDKLAVRQQLAALAGCSPAELVITRNTTEALDTVIAGHDWRPGDEAVMSHHDYGAMLDMFALQKARHGLSDVRVPLPLDPRSDGEIVELYANAITKKTRLLMVCHVVNLTGQILPVKKIVDMAHEKGVAVLVDGAHAFAQLDFKIPDLGCDYYGASLHKWLGCPLGAGILYVQQKRIAGLWPLFGDHSAAGTIERLNHTGTHPAHTDLAIADAITFHQSIGVARKEARLRHLQQYWSSKVRGLARVTMFTPADPQRSCAIATVGVAGLTPAELAKTLLDRYRIYTVAIDWAGVRGVRVTPQLYTTTAELDTLVRALRELAA